MKKQSKKKLALHKETLVSLESGRLIEAAAGAPTTTRVITECFSACTCPNTE